MTALQGWLTDGAVRDMLGRGAPLRPGSLVLAGQVLAFAGLCWLAADAWLDREAQIRERQAALLERTKSQAEPLLAKRRALFRMVEADQALNELSRLPSAQLATALGEVVGALPDGLRIERIRLDDGQLVISGWGEDPANWLQIKPGVSVETKKFPKEDKFEITTTLQP